LIAINYKSTFDQCFLNDIIIDEPGFTEYFDFHVSPIPRLCIEDLPSEVNSPPDLNDVRDLPNFIPDWMRINAALWSNNNIDDSDFSRIIQRIIQQPGIELMERPVFADVSYSIPPWLKNPSNWWSQGFISDEEFLFNLHYLINNGIIKVNGI